MKKYIKKKNQLRYKKLSKIKLKLLTKNSLIENV